MEVVEVKTKIEAVSSDGHRGNDDFTSTEAERNRLAAGLLSTT